MTEQISIAPSSADQLPDNDEIERLASELCVSGTVVYAGRPDNDTIRFLFHELSHKLTLPAHAEHHHVPLRGHAWLEDNYHLYTNDGWQSS